VFIAGLGAALTGADTVTVVPVGVWLAVAWLTATPSRLIIGAIAGAWAATGVVAAEEVTLGLKEVGGARGCSGSIGGVGWRMQVFGATVETAGADVAGCTWVSAGIWAATLGVVGRAGMLDRGSIVGRAGTSDVVN